MSTDPTEAYRNAGVDIVAGEDLVRRIKGAVTRTHRAEVMGSLGGFAGLFALGDYTDPVLVSGTDGVGTKLLVAQKLNRHDTIGIDLVAMCVNDVLMTGAEPLFFLDYFATGKLDVDIAATVVEGIAAGCEQSGCALLGGETAEMPDMYAPGHYDLAGFCVGVVERNAMLDPAHAEVGDAIVAVPSAGLHSNGFSLVRKLVVDAPDFDQTATVPGTAQSVADALLAPTAIYADLMRTVRDSVPLRSAAHITGGGLLGNLPRALPDHLGARLIHDALELPPLFRWLAQRGGLDHATMRTTFNCGIGLTLVVPAEHAETTAQLTRGWVIGHVVGVPGIDIP